MSGTYQDERYYITPPPVRTPNPKNSGNVQNFTAVERVPTTYTGCVRIDWIREYVRIPPKEQRSELLEMDSLISSLSVCVREPTPPCTPHGFAAYFVCSDLNDPYESLTCDYSMMISTLRRHKKLGETCGLLGVPGLEPIEPPKITCLDGEIIYLIHKNHLERMLRRLYTLHLHRAWQRWCSPISTWQFQKHFSLRPKATYDIIRDEWHIYIYWYIIMHI